MSDLGISMQDLGGSGGMLPQEIFGSESASEAILGQKQSRSSYTAHRVLHPSFVCPHMHLLSLQISMRDGT